MAIQSNVSKAVYTGNGTTKTFDFAFRVWAPNQVRVLVSDTALADKDVTASVSVTVGETGGTVTFDTAPAFGVTIAILRAMPFVQEDQYISGTRFDPAAVEDRLDQDCAERQQLLEAVSRAVKMPASSAQTPEEFQQAYLDNLEELKADAVSSVESLKASAVAAVTEQQQAATASATAAAASREQAAAALEQVQAIVRTSIAEAVQQCLAAASQASSAQANIEEIVLEASKQAAACIIAKCTGAAELCLQYATSAAASSCSASQTNDNIWAIIREYTIDAGEEAAQCVLSQCTVAADTATSYALASAESAAAAAASAKTVQQTINAYAQQAADKVSNEITQCIENVCLDSVAMCLEYSKAAAASSSSAAATNSTIQATIKTYAVQAAQDAAQAAAEAVAQCCQEICAECVELAAQHAKAAASSATAAAGYAQQASQTDVCKEMNARRAGDEALAERITALEQAVQALQN